MVNLLELPKEVFDAIIAAYFEGYVAWNYCCDHRGMRRHRRGSDLSETPNKKFRHELSLRYVHSRFKAAVDPYIFQSFDHPLDDFRYSCSLCRLFVEARAMRNVRALTLRDSEWRSGDEDIATRADLILAGSSSTLRDLVFTRIICTNLLGIWQQVEPSPFLQLRSVEFYDAAFAFCLPKLALHAAQLTSVHLEGGTDSLAWKPNYQCIAADPALGNGWHNIQCGQSPNYR